MTDQGPTTELGLPVPNDYSYKDSHEKRDMQFKEARDSINHIVGTLPSGSAFDAFLLGDWNLPQPQSVSGAPAWDGTFAGVISGTGGVNKATAGELALTGKSTFDFVRELGATPTAVVHVKRPSGTRVAPAA